MTNSSCGVCGKSSLDALEIIKKEKTFRSGPKLTKEIIIQSPTLDALFEVYGEIDTELELTDTGVKVIQTSDNSDVVELLQTHAAEVSDMAKRGMQAVHERMSGSSH